MVTTNAEGDPFFTIDHDVFFTELSKVIHSLLPRLDKAVKAYVWFNVFFLLLLIGELSLLCGFFGILVQSALVAIALSLIFLTVFAYFILKMVLFAKKPEQFEDFVERFTRGAQSLIKYHQGIPEHHFALANAYNKMAHAIHRREYLFFKPPAFLESLSPTCEKLSCTLFWHDFHMIKELFLKKTIEEHLLFNIILCSHIN